MISLNFTENTVIFSGFGGARETSIPTLLAMGNGRCGLRGIVPELPHEHGPGFFLAGFYDGLPRPRLKADRFTPFLRSWSKMDLVEGYHLEECLVNCPDPLGGTFRLDGEELYLDEGRADEMIRSLCVRTGETKFVLPVRTKSGKSLTLTRCRFADMAHPHLLWEECILESKDASGMVSLRPEIDCLAENGNISGIYNSTSHPEEKRWFTLFDIIDTAEEDGVVRCVVSGRVHGTQAAFATALLTPATVKLTPGHPIRFVRTAAFACEAMGDDLGVDAACRAAVMLGLEAARAKSKVVWDRLWEDSDLVIKGAPDVQIGIRHSLYHLLIACCRDSDLVSVAAKGLTGEGYRGMVFWDTDVHMLPFYLYTQPECAKRLVQFRANTLEGARAKARQYGFAGASYPWETGISGREECESFLKFITNQIHITGDVAYAVGRYLDAVVDGLTSELVETLVETARFWLSRGRMEAGLFCIPQASGPNELHQDNDNNAYVNNMAAHNLDLALEVLHRPDMAQMKERLGITENELAQMALCREQMKTMKGADGLYEQCDGFFTLEDRIVYERDEGEIPPCNTQTVKQADTLMLLFLLPELASDDELRTNWDYYEPRTTHTSSLSYGVHGILAARLGLKEKADYYLGRSLGIDLQNETGGCADGAHLAANGMSWSAIVNGMGGVTLEHGLLRLHPALPERWEELSFTLQYRGMRIRFRIAPHQVILTRSQDGGAPLPVRMAGQEVELKAGERLCLTY